MSIRFVRGNLLEADVEALVNTVNTVGVMGKGIALMFKEAFPDNFEEYTEACKEGRVDVGHVFVTERRAVTGPRWILNFPTKKHWRSPSRMAWVSAGLADLRRILIEKGIRSVAVPPLGTGQGGLSWLTVKDAITSALEDIEEVEVLVYEPTSRYHNVAKRSGVQELTPGRALVAELVRRYWVLGIECSLLEIQKLAWFLERSITTVGVDNPLDLRFSADRYGPYSDRLRHLLNALDGSYLHCEKRLADAGPIDTIWFDDAMSDRLATYLESRDARPYRAALERTTELIDGFESPLGMELLATVDWLLSREGVEPTLPSINDGLRRWPGDKSASSRKTQLFDDRLLKLALDRLAAPAADGHGPGPG
jgi:O-acetyl-ADP-ribose deacetylase (regulator of RNase III)